MRLTRRPRLWSLVVALAAVVVVASACSSSSDDANTATGDTNRGSTPLAGQTLTLYSGRDEKLIAPLIEQFSAATGIDVDVRYGNSAEMAAQLLEEGKRTPADVIYSQEVGAMGMLARSGALAPLPDEVLDTVEARFRPDEGNAWVGVTGRTRVIVYNPELIDAPAGVSELTAPEFRGKVAIVPENAGFQAFVTGFRASQGDDAARTWLEAMMANDVNAGFKSNGDVLEAVETGQMPVGLINHYYWARDERQPNLTSKLVFPKGDDPGALVNATAVGVTTKGSDNPAARALVEYLISTEGQTYFVEKTFEYPVIAGMAGPKGVPALDELEGPQLDLSDLDSLEQTQAMLRDVGLLS